jgi:hypothetical protein
MSDASIRWGPDAIGTVSSPLTRGNALLSNTSGCDNACSATLVLPDRSAQARRTTC